MTRNNETRYNQELQIEIRTYRVRLKNLRIDVMSNSSVQNPHFKFLEATQFRDATLEYKGNAKRKHDIKLVVEKLLKKTMLSE